MSEPTGSAATGSRPRGLLDHPLVQLTLVRVREFAREPEAVFWALFFPILLAAGLGVAFRSRPGRGARRSPPSAPALAAGAAAGADARRRRARPARPREALLRTGKVALLAEPGAERRGRLPLRRHESRGPHRAHARRPRRAARRRPRRSRAGHATSSCASPARATSTSWSPACVGMGIMSNAALGPRLLHRRRAPPEADEAADRDADVAARTTCCRTWSGGMMVLVVEVGVPVGFGALAFGVPVRGPLVDLVVRLPARRRCRSARWGCSSPSRADDRGRLRPDEPGACCRCGSCPACSSRRSGFPTPCSRSSSALPLTALIDALRAHMLQGAGLVQLGPQLGVLTAWLVVCFALALKLFRWR